MKKLFIALLALSVLIASALPAMAAAPAIRRVEFDGGKVEVDFSGSVQYSGAQVAVKDSSGKFYSARIVEKDGDDLSFAVSGLAAGKTYAFAIRGVRAGRSGSYGIVYGSFRVPAAKTLAMRASYDSGDRELDIEFSGNVQYKNPRVEVKDINGRSYSVKVTDADSDSTFDMVSICTPKAEAGRGTDSPYLMP